MKAALLVGAAFRNFLNFILRTIFNVSYEVQKKITLEKSQQTTVQENNLGHSPGRLTEVSQRNFPPLTS